jgi:Ser-tRNA(Ala) deacylase AlaX
MNTKLLYMHDMQALSCDAKINRIEERKGKIILILDQTVFYPQGGGQPADRGLINSENGTFRVEHVQYVGENIEHIGVVINGDIDVGEVVTCQVSETERNLHTRLHSAGHLIDLALQKLEIDWIPGKGFHFPAGSYVEYSGIIQAEEKEGVISKLELMCNELVQENYQTSIVFDENKTQGGKPLRTVYYGDFGIKCGGTHVSKPSEIGKIVIRKMKCKKGIVRISYRVE